MMDGNPTVYGETAFFTAASDQEMIPAKGVGICSVLDMWTCVNRDTVPITFILKDGTTQKAHLQVPANDSRAAFFPSGLVGSANTAWNVAINMVAGTSCVAYAGGKLTA